MRFRKMENKLHSCENIIELPRKTIIRMRIGSQTEKEEMIIADRKMGH